MKFKLTHGHARNGKSKVYQCWLHIKARCLNHNEPNYKNYGARGIKICDRWLVFTNFLADIGEPPSAKHQIDRYPNNNGNYEPGNCRWATRSENMRNTRGNHLITFNGKTQCLTAWAEELKLPRRLLYQRIHKLGWDRFKALSTPVRSY